ncbi:hypothetical protein L0F63_000349 [Massospora cicadina]|nr:hypothetical protein L0F63_000349 [Massospora cicadina]
MIFEVAFVSIILAVVAGKKCVKNGPKKVQIQYNAQTPSLPVVGVWSSEDDGRLSLVCTGVYDQSEDEVITAADCSFGKKLQITYSEDNSPEKLKHIPIKNRLKILKGWNSDKPELHNQGRIPFKLESTQGCIKKTTIDDIEGKQLTIQKVDPKSGVKVTFAPMELTGKSHETCKEMYRKKFNSTNVPIFPAVGEDKQLFCATINGKRKMNGHTFALTYKEDPYAYCTPMKGSPVTFFENGDDCHTLVGTATFAFQYKSPKETNDEWVTYIFFGNDKQSKHFA